MISLGYTQEWVDLGIIDEIDIQNQAIAQHELQDYNDEHMRYKSLVKFVNSQVVNKEIINSIIKILDKDPDKSMVIGFYVYLINKESWSDEIFSIICKKLESKDIINQATIIREFKFKNDLSKETVNNYINNEKYHRLLVDCITNISLLEKISKISKSKKIKNIINLKIKKLIKS
jgi:hypothetical protein